MGEAEKKLPRHREVPDSPSAPEKDGSEENPDVHSLRQFAATVQGPEET